MSFVGSAVALASAIGGAVIGNQQKQKAKGEAGQVERDSQAAQAAADAKLREQHTENIQAQSQTAEIARKKMEQPLAGSPKSPTLLGGPSPINPNASAVTAPLQPIQRKTLLGS